MSKIQFPQGPFVDLTTGLVTQAWRYWLLNPQVLSFSISQALAVDSGGTGLTSGTSGGILGFTAANTVASSALLNANALVLGGGVGFTPSTPVGLGAAHQVLHGNAVGAPSWSAVDLAADVTGNLPLGSGGTGANLTASNGGIFYSTGSVAAILAGTVTAGQILRSGASSAPSWSTATYPATAGTSGNVLQSNGTNFVSTALPASAWAEISTGTASGSASLNFTGLTGYAAYLFVIENLLPVTDGVDLWMRVSTDNGSTWKSGSNYEWALEKNLAGSGVNQASLGDTKIKLATLVTAITGNGTQGYSGTVQSASDLSIAASEKSFIANGVMSNTSSNLLIVHAVGGYFGDSTAVNGVQFLFSSGNISTGKIRCYGLNG